MSSVEEFEMEALKTLHDGYLQNLHALSERPFHAMLQTVALNVAVVAGLIAGGLHLSPLAKVLGTALLFLFNILVVAYIQLQGSRYEEEKGRYEAVRNSLLAKCLSLGSQPINPPTHHPCIEALTGTNFFSVAVFIAAVCSTIALWCPLVTSR